MKIIIVQFSFQSERVTLSDLLAVDCKAVTVSTLTSLAQTQTQSSEQILLDLLLQAFLSASNTYAAVSGHVPTIDTATAKGMLMHAIGKAQGTYVRTHKKEMKN